MSVNQTMPGPGRAEVALDEVVVDRGPGRFRECLRPFFVVVDQTWCSEHSRQTRRSETTWPARSSSSAMKRYPNSGSSAWTSTTAFSRCASWQSRLENGSARPEGGLDAADGSVIIEREEDAA